MSTGSNLPAMSNAAFAGFLRLLLTPLNESPEPSEELRAYLDYLGRACPRDEWVEARKPRTARVA